MFLSPSAGNRSVRHLNGFNLRNIKCTLDYPCADYPVCGLSVHERKLLMANDEGRKLLDLAARARK